LKPLSSLSILCLAYNEEENIRWALPQLQSLLDQTTNDGEIVIVTHPKSADGTNEFIRSESQKDQRIRACPQPENTKGYGLAFAHGLKQLSKDFTFHVDIDGQFLFQDLFRAIELQKAADADLVHFNRLRRKDPLERKIIGLVFKMLVHSLYRCPVWDFDSAFNLFRTKTIKDIQIKAMSGMTVPELMIRIGQKTEKIVVGWTEHQPRRAGKPLWEVRSPMVPFILPNADIVKANLRDLWLLRKTLGSRI
jgi:glycosyltransferase involved in cell wall biosynthesis